MKKTLLAIAGIVLLATVTHADYVRTTRDGGPDGYNSTSKEVSGQNTTIECSDPGFESCPTIVNPGDGGIPAAAQEICYEHAIGQIREGRTVGQKVIDVRGMGRFAVTWSSRDENAYSSKIEIKKV